MKKTTPIIAAAALVLLGWNMWEMDVQPIPISLEQWDVDVVDGIEMRINVPSHFGGYFLTYCEGFHTTAGTSAGADSTTIEITDITDATIIDTLVILEDLVKGVLSGMSYEVTAGTELAFKVLHTTTTKPKGLRITPVFSDVNAIR